MNTAFNCRGYVEYIRIAVAVNSYVSSPGAATDGASQSQSRAPCKQAADLMHMHVSVGPVRCANDKPMRQLQQQQLTQQQQEEQQQRQIAIEVNFSKLHAKMC